MKRYYLLCALAFVAAASFAQNFVYQKVTAEPSDWTGEYLIVREVDSTATAWVFNGALAELDVKKNCFSVSVDKSSDRIAATAETNAATFTIAKRSDGTYSIRSHSGYYFGYNKLDTADLNNLKFDVVDKYPLNISFESDTTTKVRIQSKSGYVLRYNADPLSNRFRFYAEGKKKGVHLYRKVDTTALSDQERQDAPAVDGSLYFLPKGFYIVNGRLVYRAK